MTKHTYNIYVKNGENSLFVNLNKYMPMRQWNLMSESLVGPLCMVKQYVNCILCLNSAGLHELLCVLAGLALFCLNACHHMLQISWPI